MNLIHIVPRIDQEAAGCSYVVPRLCQSLAELDNYVELSCLAAKSTIPGVMLDLHKQWPVIKRFEISHGLPYSIFRKSYNVEIIHNHSLWSMVNVACGWVAPGRKAKLVTSPHGTLSTWALNRSRHLKSLLWPFQCRALEKADLLHATSYEEYQQIRAAGFTAPIAIIPNGIDIPNVDPKREAKNIKQMNLLFLGRIHPVKGIDRLLHTWQQLQSRYSHWNLIIAGCGDPQYVKEIQDLAKSLRLERVDFPGPIYGEEKSRAYCQADLFVLPTHTENFGMVVAEALAHGCPALVTRGAPWAGLETEGCGWWIENSIEALVSTLNLAMQMDRQQLEGMGQLGRAWMERDYGWSSIAQKMDASYRWLLNGGETPAWIKMD